MRECLDWTVIDAFFQLTKFIGKDVVPLDKLVNFLRTEVMVDCSKIDLDIACEVLVDNGTLNLERFLSLFAPRS